MTTEPDRGPAPSEEERQAWDAIVAELSGELSLTAADAEPAADDVVEYDEFNGSEHDTFIPPEPPPIPRPADGIARFAWAAVLGGPILLLLSVAFSMGRFISGVAVVTAIAGFITLIARKQERSPDEQWGEEHFGDGAIR